MMRHDFLVLALAIVLNHTACGTDNSRIGGTAPEPPAQTPSKQADSMKIRSGSEKVTIEPASQSSDQASEVGLRIEPSSRSANARRRSNGSAGTREIYARYSSW
jgi:hypothetical protein